jgi:predicted oxidoreductase
MAAVVKAQYEAQGPLAPVSSGVLKKYADKDFNDRVTSSTQVPFPPSIDAAWEAAGCGGGGTGGSACG